MPPSPAGLKTCDTRGESLFYRYSYTETGIACRLQVANVDETGRYCGTVDGSEGALCDDLLLSWLVRLSAVPWQGAGTLLAWQGMDCLHPLFAVKAALGSAGIQEEPVKHSSKGLSFFRSKQTVCPRGMSRIWHQSDTSNADSSSRGNATYLICKP